jgi:hypothetical protein
MLTLGIPGSATTAIMLGGLMMWGLRPGPLLFEKNPDFVWGLIASLYLANVMLLVLNLPLAPVFAALLRVRYAYIAPGILAISLVGAYANTLDFTEVWIALAFGVVGWFMIKMDFPRAPPSDNLSFARAGIPHVGLSVVPRLEAHQLWLLMNGGEFSGLREGFLPDVLHTIHTEHDTAERLDTAAMTLAYNVLTALIVEAAR